METLQSINPFPEAKILDLNAGIERAKVTAESFLRCYLNASPEAVEVATAIKNNNYLTNPLLIISLSARYSEMLRALTADDDPLELLNNVYASLYPVFNETGVCHE